MSFHLGAVEPPDRKHVEKYPAAAMLGAQPDVVKRTIRLPRWHANHNQGSTSSCVGHAVALVLATMNYNQHGETRRYDPIDIWRAARLRDEWADNDDFAEDHGTSLRAGFDFVREFGPRRVRSMRRYKGTPRPVNPQANDLSEGIAANRWLVTVDEMRAAIDAYMPLAVATSWHQGWNRPVKQENGLWLPPEAQWGRVVGGHAFVIHGADDDREAFLIHNSWGCRDWGHTWCPYAAWEKLQQTVWTEAVLISDR